MKKNLKIILIALLLALSTGCAGLRISQFVPGPEGENTEITEIADPEEKIIIIYNHGSTYEIRTDPCRPCREKDVWGTPKVITSLSGEIINNKEILVYSLCTSIKYGEYNGYLKSGELKVVKRAKEIKRKVDEFIMAGVPGNQIFLAGHSAGAWASLLMLRDNPGYINSVIAFAPAFAGMYKKRKPGWEWINKQQIMYLLESSYLPSMIYVFKNDPYYRTGDLSPLAMIPGVEFMDYDFRKSGKLDCASDGFRGHVTDFSDCFAVSEKERVLDFLKSRLY